MQSGSRPGIINGINLDNYYPNGGSYNSVVYVHKKFLEPPNEKKDKPAKEKKKKKGKKEKCDKSQQVEEVVNNGVMLNTALMGQSVQFAIPVVIPPNDIVSPMYYTIKATKKARKKTKELSNVTYKKEKSKRIVETYRNDKGSQKESLSVKETISYMSNSDTLDELHLNPSLCCTFSDVSDHKQVKKEKREKLKLDHKLMPSESFEALATEFLNNAGDTKIKIYLMNETEKNLLAENIRQPLLKGIRECVLELNNQNQHENTEVTTVQKFVKCNTQKLDSVIDKLAYIEQKIANLDKYISNENYKAKAPDKHISKDITVVKAPKVQQLKASTLEQLGEDVLELQEESSGDEYYPRPALSARKKAKGAVVQLEPAEIGDSRDGGAGEEGQEGAIFGGGQPMNPTRPNRIPARFCWTDAARKNVK